MDQIYRNILQQNYVRIFQKPELINCNNCGSFNLETGYSKTLKCCNFQPFFANYLIGYGLSRTKTFEIYKQAIESRNLLPYGMFPYEEDVAAFLKNNHPSSQALTCTFYKNSKCTIWEGRPGECVNFYCKSQNGKAGLERWQKLSFKISNIEFYLSEMCLLHKGFTWDEVKSQRFLPEGMPQFNIDHFWLDIVDKESFYKDCFQLVVEKGAEWMSEYPWETIESINLS